MQGSTIAVSVMCESLVSDAGYTDVSLLLMRIREEFVLQISKTDADHDRI